MFTADQQFLLYYYGIFPALCIIGGIIIFLIIRKNIRRNHAENVKRREAGIQSRKDSLSGQMNQMYVKYHEKGFAPSWVKEDFKKLFDEYRKLGTSEEIENLRDKFYSLPDNMN